MREFLLIIVSLAYSMAGIVHGVEPAPPPIPASPPLSPALAPPPLAPPGELPGPPNNFPTIPGKDGPIEKTWLPKAKLREPAAGDDDLRHLLIARYNAALTELNSIMIASEHGLSRYIDPEETHVRVLNAELGLSDKPADQIAALEFYRDSRKQVESDIKAMYVANVPGFDTARYQQALYSRLDAEIRLLLAKRKAGLAK